MTNVFSSKKFFETKDGRTKTTENINFLLFTINIASPKFLCGILLENYEMTASGPNSRFERFDELQIRKYIISKSYQAVKF